MKNTLIYSDYDEKTGISKVTIGNKYGTFTATCKIAEQDQEHPSKYAGCCFAEIKATIKSFKKELKTINIEIQSFDNFFDQLISSKKYNKDSYEAKQAKKYRRELLRHKQDVENAISQCESLLNYGIAERDRYFSSKKVQEMIFTKEEEESKR